MTEKTSYISTDSVVMAYNELCKIEISNASVLHIFFILKGCGFNSISYQPVSDIADKGYEKASPISMLFSPYEKLPDKHDFINPFDMKSWSTQPTETLTKWIASRVKNNVLGGAITWRELINYDTVQNQIKFSYNYIDVIRKLTLLDQKVNLNALAVWANRFSAFPQEVGFRELVQSFVREYNLSTEEIAALTHTQTREMTLSFSDKMHDSSKIRNLIGSPATMSNWIKSERVGGDENNFLISDKIFSMDTISAAHLTEKKILDALGDYYQVVISGPPGTSKSFLAESVSKNFDKVVKLQFHPQYDYQAFVGGFVVNVDKVEYRPGILPGLVDYAIENPTEKCLLIIEEINRANVSQVFGEIIQCLDRNYSTTIRIDNEDKEISLPKNLYILGTMNTSDRTLGSIDHAVRRRFIFMYCPPDPDSLMSLCTMEGGLSLKDFLQKLNSKLYTSLKNRELVIGQSVFFNEKIKNGEKFEWNFEKLETLFNYKILPIIEDFCYGDEDKVGDILGEKLPLRLNGEEFKKEFEEFLSL